ncbi:MAG: UDP-N-acetylglucosamine 2-epimerase (non-hydrolyzing) [Crocinitomicaceae bacterium]|nr:UDP-N-acetylglucosamine 2-epimerase (non-hydrolyzing) [Crocinitomicaceae bacterium]
MIKLVTVIGARPQFIKAAAISRAVNTSFSDEIEEIIVHTGQHYDSSMSNVFFNELQIPKEKYNLNIGSGSHALQTANMMIEIEKVVLEEKPDAILLYGDTNSTLSACLVAIKLHIPIIHVEAGVRGYNKRFPEEVNRLVCDHMSSLLFVPSIAGIKSLEIEGLKHKKNGDVISLDNPGVFHCGDIMYDNTLFYKEKIKNRLDSIFSKYDLPKENYILTTMHRPSNVDQNETLESILKALNQLIDSHGKTIVLPLHPRTKNRLDNQPELGPLLNNERLRIIPPVSFLEMIELEENSDLVITDSGGVQKEAYFLKKPCLIMLDETPWIELLESGNAILTGSDYNKIVNGANEFLKKGRLYEFMDMYGDGKASEFICQEIIKAFN